MIDNFKTYFLIAILSFLSFSCLDMTVTYRINENGKVTSIMNYTSTNEYGNYLIPDMRDNLINEGYTITKFTGQAVEGIIYTDVNTALSNSIFAYDTEKLDQGGPEINADFFSSVEESLTKKTFTINYVFPKNDEYDPDLIDADDFGSQIALGLLATFNISFIINIPGEIVETTGKVISYGTVRWDYTMLDLLQNGGNIYIKSKVENNIATLLSAQKKTQKEILKVYSKMDELKFRTLQLDSISREQIKINRSVSREVNKSDKALINLINLLVEDYFEKNNQYPTGIQDIKDYNNKLGFEELPNLSNGVLVFDVEKNIFKMKE